MAGLLASKTRKILASVPAPKNLADPCDLQFRVDLVGVRSEVSRTLTVGVVLEVGISTRGSARSAVCRVAPGGDVVGTLAAFVGLAQLISCIDKGQRYVAHVEAASAVRCSVLVVRSA